MGGTAPSQSTTLLLAAAAICQNSSGVTTQRLQKESVSAMTMEMDGLWQTSLLFASLEKEISRKLMNRYLSNCHFPSLVPLSSTSKKPRRRETETRRERPLNHISRVALLQKSPSLFGLEK